MNFARPVLKFLAVGRIFAAGVLVALLFAQLAPAADRPNIVLVMADDLGFSDLGCYGGEIETPNLDRLATRGLRFTQFHNAGRCCPSRASLITGLYPSRTGVGHMTTDLQFPGYRGELSGNCPTIAEVLKSAGYGTYMVGKWHLVLSQNMQPQGDHANWPNQRGFDHYYGNLSGTSSYWDPITLIEDNRPIRAAGDYYYTEVLSQKAVDYIDDGVRSGKPFFLYVAYTAPHYPLHARPERIAKYRGRFDGGWDVLRARRHARLIEMGLIPPDTPLSRRDEMSRAWEDEDHQNWEARRMEVYAAMVDHLDEGVGRIVRHLETKGVLDRTLFLFLSDNGGSAEAHPDGRVERTGQRWNDPAARPSTRDGRPVRIGNFFDHPLGADDTFGSYGAKWANVSNTPFRRFKSWVHEGGIATPLIAHWPGHISNRGGLSHDYGHIVDIMATCVDVAGAVYPRPAAGRPPPPELDGRSLAPVLGGRNRDPRPYFWEHEGNRAVRLGRWKLVSEFPGEWATLRSYPQQGRWELYDIDRDRTETRDLATEEAGKAGELAGLYESWAGRAAVVPWAEIQARLSAKTSSQPAKK